MISLRSSRIDSPRQQSWIGVGSFEACVTGDTGDRGQGMWGVLIKHTAVLVLILAAYLGALLVTVDEEIWYVPRHPDGDPSGYPRLQAN